MKTTFEPEDIQAVADKVAEILKPLLVAKVDRSTDDQIFDIPGLCEYLTVTRKWIHERTHLKEIPYFKLSNKQLRFRKRDIDRWLESLKTPAINPFNGRLKAIR